MSRRSFLKGITSVFCASGLSVPAWGAQQCQQSPYGPACSSYVPIDSLASVYAVQQLPEWCWAASISMIFAFSGHPIEQARIVQDAYGGIGNIPGSYPAMLGSLNRRWRDDNGDVFRVSIKRLFAADLGANSISSFDLIAALNSENPVLFCTVSHAMILTSLSYIATPGGPQIFEAWAMDPWPGRGLRKLFPPEIVPVQLGGQLRMAALIDLN